LTSNVAMVSVLGIICDIFSSFRHDELYFSHVLHKLAVDILAMHFYCRCKLYHFKVNRSVIDLNSMYVKRAFDTQ